jgi:exodeoxyribonuclease VII small subunit
LERPVIPTPLKTQDATKPVGDMSFEAALKELEIIVARLEQGEVDLEDSIALYERGQALKAHCEAKLKAAEGRLEKIVQGAGGPAIGERLDVA